MGQIKKAFNGTHLARSANTAKHSPDPGNHQSRKRRLPLIPIRESFRGPIAHSLCPYHSVVDFATVESARELNLDLPTLSSGENMYDLTLAVFILPHEALSCQAGWQVINSLASPRAIWSVGAIYTRVRFAVLRLGQLQASVAGGSSTTGQSVEGRGTASIEWRVVLVHILIGASPDQLATITQR